MNIFEPRYLTPLTPRLVSLHLHDLGQVLLSFVILSKLSVANCCSLQPHKYNVFRKPEEEQRMQNGIANGKNITVLIIEQRLGTFRDRVLRDRVLGLVS